MFLFVQSLVVQVFLHCLNSSTPSVVATITGIIIIIIHSFTKSQNVTFLLCSSLSDHCSLNPNVISQVHNDGRSEILNMITEKV